MLVTGLYAALVSLLALILAGRVVSRRRESGIGIGDGGDKDLARRRRVQGNLLEYVPLALLLLLILELDHTSIWLLHLFGIVLLVARVLHAWGLNRSVGTSFGRLAGTALTWLLMLTMIGLLLWKQILVWMV